jgi:sarcosine oxidase subunit alpha
MRTDLVVIGAGPAGLSAAITAASYGAKVVVVDENQQPGGKLLGQLHEEPGTGWWIGKNIAEELLKKALSYGVKVWQQNEVWGLYPGWRVKSNRHPDIEAACVLLATGAAERGLPIPGWTLPGVMAVGAAQVMANVHRVRPGNRILVVGVDALSMTIARELSLAGAEVVGIALPPPSVFIEHKAEPRFHMETLSRLADMAPSAFLRMAGKMVHRWEMGHLGARLYPKRGVRLWGVPLWLRKAVLSLGGTDHVQSATLADVTPDGRVLADTASEISVDCVCLSGGLYPLTELAGAAGCRFVHVPELGGHVPLHNSHLETTVDGLYVAGNITGIEGARVAIAQGELAGTSIASRLQLANPQQLKKAVQKVKEIRKSSGFHFHADIEAGRKKMIELWENPSMAK